MHTIILTKTIAISGLCSLSYGQEKIEKANPPQITPIQVGEEEREITLPDLGGKLIRLGDFKGKKNILISVGRLYG